MEEDQNQQKPEVPLCFSCRWFHREIAGRFSCEAFDEIPVEMLLGRRSHSTPLPGQINAVVYEKISIFDGAETAHGSLLGKLSLTAEKLAQLHFVAVEKFDQMLVVNDRMKK